MKLTMQEIQGILKSDFEWHTENSEPKFTKDFQEGFRFGIRHSMWIIKWASMHGIEKFSSLIEGKRIGDGDKVKNDTTY